jgi:hypothetical protein
VLKGDGPILPRIEAACAEVGIAFNKGFVGKLLKHEVIRTNRLLGPRGDRSPEIPWPRDRTARSAGRSAMAAPTARAAGTGPRRAATQRLFQTWTKGSFWPSEARAC